MHLRKAASLLAGLLGWGVLLPTQAADPPADLVPPKAAIDYFRSHQPTYPSSSRSLFEEGKVTTVILVDETGRAQCSVGESSGFDRLDTAVLDLCANAPQFAPARENGQPRAYTFKLRYEFSLTDENDPQDCVRKFDSGANHAKIRLVAEIAALRVAADRAVLEKSLGAENLDEVPRALYRAIHDDKDLSPKAASNLQVMDPRLLSAVVSRVSARQRAVLDEPEGYFHRLDTLYRCELATRFSAEDLEIMKRFYATSTGAAVAALDSSVRRQAAALEMRQQPEIKKAFMTEIAATHAARRQELGLPPVAEP